MDTLDASSKPAVPTIAPRPTAYLYGAIWAGAAAAVELIVYLLNPDPMAAMEDPTAKMLGYLSMLIAPVVIVMAVMRYRDRELGGAMDAGLGLKIGFWVGLVAGVIGIVWTLLYLYGINSESLEAARNMVDEKMEEQGGEGAEMARSIAGFFTNPIAISIFVLLGRMFWGFLVGLIAGLILKKDGRNYA